MKDEVIIVQSPQDVAEAIKRISIDELVFIDIDKTLIEGVEIIRVSDQEHKVIINGYQFNFLIRENSDWYGLLWVTDSNKKEYIYSLLSYHVWGWLEKKCGYHNVYIQKEGSNAKIDEE